MTWLDRHGQPVYCDAEVSGSLGAIGCDLRKGHDGAHMSEGGVIRWSRESDPEPSEADARYAKAESELQEKWEAQGHL